MKGSRFTEEQIIAVLREADGGTPVKELCCRAGISTVTFYKWKSKYADMEISELRRMRLLQDENVRLKRIVAQQAGYRCAEGGVVKKVVGPQAEPGAVRVVREVGKLIERRACGLIGMNRSSWRYQQKDRNEIALRSRLRELAGERPNPAVLTYDWIRTAGQFRLAVNLPRFTIAQATFVRLVPDTF